MPTKPVLDEKVDIGGLALHYIQWGERGRPIVCVHGLTANTYFFQALADTLATDHQVFAYDLRGRGDSDKPEQGYSVPIHADDLAKFIDRLGLEHPVLIGHSLGALIALYFAAQHPNKLSKLVLVDAGTPLPWNTPDALPAWLTASINRLGTSVPSFEEYTQRLKAAPFIGPYWNEYLELYFEHDVRRSSNGSVVAKSYREGVLEEGRRFHEVRPEEQWARVQVPTLFLRAGQGLFFDNDQLVPEEAAAAAQRGLKNCRFVNFPTLNHYTILLGVEDGPVEEIRKFVDDGSENS